MHIIQMSQAIAGTTNAAALVHCWSANDADGNRAETLLTTTDGGIPCSGCGQILTLQLELKVGEHWGVEGAFEEADERPKDYPHLDMIS